MSQWMKPIIWCTVYFWDSKLRNKLQNKLQCTSQYIFVLNTFVGSFLLIFITCLLPVHGQQSLKQQNSISPHFAQKKFLKKTEPAIDIFDRITTELGDIWRNGQDELFIAGHSYHSRARYAAKDIARFNEQNTGLGWAKTHYTRGVLNGRSGQSSGLYVMGFSSSIRDTQWNLGYLHKWHSPSWGGFQVAGGYTALLLSRPDVIQGVPVPVILPVGSFDTRYLSLELVYFPPINLAPAAQGDVFFLFARARW